MIATTPVPAWFYQSVGPECGPVSLKQLQEKAFTSEIGPETWEQMRELALNLLVVCVVGSPLILLEVLRRRSTWIDKHSEGVRFFVWLLTLVGVWFWLLPALGLVPNWRVLAP